MSGRLRTLIAILVHSPGRSLAILGASSVSTIMEAASILTLVPLLDIILDTNNLVSNDQSTFIRLIVSMFHYLGLDLVLANVLFVFFLLITFKAVFSLLSMNYIGIVITRFSYELRRDYLEALIRAKWRTVQARKVGESLNTLNYEVPKAASIYRYACLLISSSIQVLILIYLMLEVSVPAAMGGIGLGIFMFVILGFLVSYASRQSRRLVEYMDLLMVRVDDVLGGMKVIKAMNLSKFISPLLFGMTDEIRDATKKQVIAKHGLVYLREPIIILFVCLGLYLALQKLEMDPNNVMLVLFIFVRLAQMLGKLQSDYQTYAINEPFYHSHLNKINDLGKSTELIEGTSMYDDTLFDISFENVCLRHGRNEILKDVSISFPQKGLVSIEGESGSGKTSLVDTLIGLYDLDGGSIRINGRLLSKETIPSLRNNLGYLGQDPFVFDSSVYENLTMGDPQIRPQDVEMAVDRANCRSFLNALENGLETKVGQGGIVLSGGQRQRIALARALIKQPNMLILDEFTSALDDRSTLALLDAIEDISKSVLVIAVSHDQRVISRASKKYEIRDGKVAECAI